MIKKSLLFLILALSFAAPVYSGGIVDRVFSGGAKSLAKQAVNLIKQAAALQEKAAGIEEKALALSDKDRRTYQAELERLGFQPPEWLFNDAQALLTGAPPAPESPGGILGFLAGIFGGGSRNSGARNSGAEPTEAEIQAALEAAQQILGGGANAPPATTPTPTSAPAPTPTQSATTTTTRTSGDWTWTAVANSGIWQYTSSSGRTETAGINAIAYGNNMFVAGSNRGRMAYSSDGVSWTAVAYSGFNGSSIRAIAYGMNAEGNGMFVAVSWGGGMAYSSDGVSWTRVANNTFGDSDINAIAYGNNRLVLHLQNLNKNQTHLVILI